MCAALSPCAKPHHTVSIAVTFWREPGGAGGLMTEVLTEVVNWALNQPGIFRIGAVCDVENIGSARVAHTPTAGVRSWRSTHPAIEWPTYVKGGAAGIPTKLPPV
jgi:hypothetical protein